MDTINSEIFYKNVHILESLLKYYSSVQTSDLTPWESHVNLEEKFEKYGQDMVGGGINTGCDTFLRRETRKELSYRGG